MAELGRYEILGSLGGGGFGTVYRAWDPALRREVALKTLLPQIAADPVVRQRFLAEARAIAGLRHPNIVVVYDVGEAESGPFFAMEIVDGYSLADLIADGRGLDLHRVIEIVTSLSGAVDYLHAAGLIHRDIKAANVMVDRSGRVVLMDFGIARSLRGTQHTQANMVLGTPETMAPEQVLSQPVGPAADIYSLGVLTYQLLTGRLPFQGDTLAVLHAHAYEPPPPLWDLRPDLPDTVYAVVQEAMAKDPSLRPAYARAFAAGLAGTTVPPPISTASPPPADTTPRPPSGSTAAGGSGALPAIGAAGPPSSGMVVSSGADRTTSNGYLVTTASDPHERPAPKPQHRGPLRLALAAFAAVVLLAVAAGVGVLARRGSGAGGTAAAPAAASAPVPPETPTTFTATTYAGSGTAGFADGPAATAEFNDPYGVAVDGADNVYVADFGNNRIRKISPQGVVSTVAGTGEPGFADGPGASARLNQPTGVAVDPGGVIYFADRANNRIRKISPQGVVSTIAGTGDAGFADGAGATAQFNSPGGVAVDRTGNIYVADFGNHRIRKISQQGTVSTLAGSGVPGFADGPAASAQFNSPAGIALDRAGNLYVADFGNDRIRKISPTGVVSTAAGSGDPGFADGPGAAAQLKAPFAVAVDAAENVYVTDRGNERIRIITPAGDIRTIAGNGTPGYLDGPGSAALFNGSIGVAAEPDGALFVADRGNERIRKLTPDQG